MYVMAWSTVTKYHNLSSLNNRHLFLTVLESGKSKVKTGAWLSSDESTLGLQTAVFLLYTDMEDRKRGLESLPLLNKITNLSCMLNHFSPVRLFATPWTVACQPPLSMGFLRQEYWSGLLFPPPGILSWGHHFSHLNLVTS